MLIRRMIDANQEVQTDLSAIYDGYVKNDGLIHAICYSSLLPRFCKSDKKSVGYIFFC